MKKLILLIFLLPFLALAQTAYYIAPDGNDTTGDGSIGSPWLTISKANSVMVAGDTMYARGGTYDISYNFPTISSSGSLNNYFHYYAYPGESPVFDGTNMPEYAARRGMVLTNTAYLKFYGLHWANYSIAGTTTIASGIYISGSANNIIFENCKVSNVQGHGFHRWDTGSGTADSLYFINVDSYDHQYPGGGTAATDGFNIGQFDHDDYTFFSGCRVWNVSDDAFDNAGAESRGLIEHHDTWAIGTVNGDGNGFKMITWGGSNWQEHDYVIRRYVRCISVFNDVHGFHENQSPAILNVEAYNNLSYNNGGIGFYIPTTGTELTTNRGLYKNNISYNNVGNNFQSGWGHIREIHIDENNTWNTGFSVSASDFVSLPDSTTIVTAMTAPRQADGSLPDLGDIFKLSPESPLINAGQDVGIPYSGTAPDLGPFEYVVSSVPDVTDLLLQWDAYTFTPLFGLTSTTTIVDAYNTQWDSIASNLSLLRQVVEAITATTITWDDTPITPITFSMRAFEIRTAINTNNETLFNNMDSLYIATLTIPEISSIAGYDMNDYSVLGTPSQMQFVWLYNWNIGILTNNTQLIFDTIDLYY